MASLDVGIRVSAQVGSKVLGSPPRETTWKVPLRRGVGGCRRCRRYYRVAAAQKVQPTKAARAGLELAWGLLAACRSPDALREAQVKRWGPPSLLLVRTLSSKPKPRKPATCAHAKHATSTGRETPARARRWRLCELPCARYSSLEDRRAAVDVSLNELSEVAVTGTTTRCCRVRRGLGFASVAVFAAQLDSRDSFWKVW